jgi:hypothetical protein
MADALRHHLQRQHPARAWRVWYGESRATVQQVRGDLVCDCGSATLCAHRLRVQLGRMGWQAVDALRALVARDAEEAGKGASASTDALQMTSAEGGSRGREIEKKTTPPRAEATGVRS